MNFPRYTHTNPASASLLGWHTNLLFGSDIRTSCITAPRNKGYQELQQGASPNGSGAVVCGSGVSWLTVGALGRSSVVIIGVVAVTECSVLHLSPTVNIYFQKNEGSSSGVG